MWLLLGQKHEVHHTFRTKPPLGFRRWSPRPVSQDSLRALLAWDDFGGRIDRLSCRTRTLTFPRLMSLGGFGSRSTNFRFWLVANLLLANGDFGTWTTGSAARISSGISSGSEDFPKGLRLAWGIWPSPLIDCEESPKGLGKDSFVPRALPDGLSSGRASFADSACSLSLLSCFLRLSFLSAFCLIPVSYLPPSAA